MMICAVIYGPKPIAKIDILSKPPADNRSIVDQKLDLAC